MIDTDLIMNKEDYLKNDLINTLRDKINFQSSEERRESPFKIKV